MRNFLGRPRLTTVDANGEKFMIVDACRRLWRLVEEMNRRGKKSFHSRTLPERSGFWQIHRELSGVGAWTLMRRRLFCCFKEDDDEEKKKERVVAAYFFTLICL